MMTNDELMKFNEASEPKAGPGNIVKKTPPFDPFLVCGPGKKKKAERLIKKLHDPKEPEEEPTEYQKFLHRTLDFHNFSVAAHVDRVLRDKGAATKDVHEAIMSTPTNYYLAEPKGYKFQKEIDAPKFKTLEDWGWKLYGVQTFHCRTQIVSYDVFYSPSRGEYRWREVGEPSLSCDSIDHGKQLAQKDYEEKCKSLLK